MIRVLRKLLDALSCMSLGALIGMAFERLAAGDKSFAAVYGLGALWLVCLFVLAAAVAARTHVSKHTRGEQ